MQNTSRKEIIIAVIVGLSSGILAAYLLYSVKKKPSVQEKVKVNTSTTNYVLQKSQDSKTSQQNNVQQLTISSPNDNSIINNPIVEIVGKAPKNSLVYISSEVNDQVFQIKDQIDFKINIDLVSGENIINITNILNNGREDSSILTIIYDQQ